jgi:hypothetical protein
MVRQLRPSRRLVKQWLVAANSQLFGRPPLRLDPVLIGLSDEDGKTAATAIAATFAIVALKALWRNQLERYRRKQSG